MTRIKTSFFLVLWMIIGQCHCFPWIPYKPDNHKTAFQKQLNHRLTGTTLIFFKMKKWHFFCILDFQSPLQFNYPIIWKIKNRLQFLMGKVTQSTKGLISNPTPRPHSTLNEKYLFTMKKQRIDQLGRLWIIEFHLLSRWWFWGLKKLTIKWNMFKYTHQIWIFAIFAVIYTRMETFWALFETLKKSGNFWAWK